MPNEESRLKRDDPLTTIMAQTDSSEVRFFFPSLKYISVAIASHIRKYGNICPSFRACIYLTFTLAGWPP
jgi:hypothetical protein